MSIQRPLGPRPVHPPSPGSLSINETAPLVIRKPTPRLGLVVSPNNSIAPPTRNDTGRSTTPKPSLKLKTSSNAGEPLHSEYYNLGGPNPLDSNPSTGPPDEPTIRPNSGTQVPAPRADAVPDIVTILAELEIGSKSSNSSATNHESSSSIQWSDDVLEEIERLGEGAGGAVHKVKDKRDGTVMARKTITTRGAPMKQLLRELSIISSNTHRNIIRFYGAYMSPSTSEVKILMEYCEGGSLEAVGKRIKDRGGIVGEKIAGRLAEGVLQGLAYLHSKKTIHRDIKPSNILLSKEGVVILCDFGVSGELVDSIAGTFTGTSFYMAPERISGNEYTIRSDVWSTGISLLELVQNRFPFPNDLPPIELMMHITSAEPPRLEDEPGVQWSSDMKDFIKQALTVDALTRPTPKDMLEHPWIVGVMKQEVKMARWIMQVWDWPKPPKRVKDSNPSGSSPPGVEESPSRTGET